MSLNSFLGLSSPTTTKMLGAIKKHKVVIMLDSGATYNFIAPSTVQMTHLRIEEKDNLKVLLGTGVQVKGLGVCRNVQFGIQDLLYEADFIALELGNADVILGIQ